MNNPTDTATEYSEFLASKGHDVEAAGFESGPISEKLYPFQADIVRWALRCGRAAIFADCGMGKSFMQLEWARAIGDATEGAVLIVAPLAVAEQTIAEGAKLGIEVTRVGDPSEFAKLDSASGIYITNYERLHKFDPSMFDGVVLDESSILKSIDGKTRTHLIKEWSKVPYRLCCTATPAPNDVTELANHAEFLGAMSRAEMLATFFVHDAEDVSWRLKGHAAADMWKWMARWAVFVRRPSDLGYPDQGWALPPLSVKDEVVATGIDPAEMGGITKRSAVRRQTLAARVAKAAEIITGVSTWTSGNTTGSTTSALESSSSQSSAATAQPTETQSTQRSAPSTPPTRDPSEPRSNGTSNDIQGSAETSVSSSTASQAPNTTSCSSSKVSAAQSADASIRSSSSTTTTEPAKSEASFALTATSGSVASTTTQSFSVRQSDTSSQWLVWVDLNDEGRELVKLLRSLGVTAEVVEGADSDKHKFEAEAAWREGRARVLICKPSQFGFGMNWQHCSQVLFLGLGDSFEKYYQAIRRCWRFGQKNPVDVRIVVSDVEGVIADNVKRKEREADQMAESIVAAVRDTQKGTVRENREDVYEPKTAETDNWALMLGDCVERVKELPDASVGFSVFSPPFASLYTYSSSRRDMGNSKSFDEFFAHFRYLIPELKRVLMPGRRVAVHCQQLSTTKATHGFIGWRDFRGELIREFQKHFIYDGEICIDKNPQAQAIRTKSKQLMFVQKEKDSSWLRPAMADYVLLFRHPEENAETPVKTDVTNEEWILFAHPIWYGIRESNVLRSYRDAREDEDEKHICPLQLETIERCVRLWSNKGDVILSPFAGIGSEGYVSLRHGRKFIGVELKESYWQIAKENLELAEREGPAQATEAAGLAEIIAKREAKKEQAA